MSMLQNGLCKLTEESGELLQVIGKLTGYPLLQLPTDQLHPDGSNLREWLELEMGDVLAAIEFVKVKLRLDQQVIAARSEAKLKLFRQWDLEP